ncbi:alpha/beta hydrolase [Sphingomonas sp.]
MMDRRALLTLGVGAGAGALAMPLRAQTAPPIAPGVGPAITDPHETIDLWPDGAVTPPSDLVERAVQRATDPATSDRYVLGVTRPRLVVFRPVKTNGRAVLVTPGGGYRWIVVDKEGYELGRWLSARGYTVFILFYRLPGEGWADRANVPLADAQRAMRIVRSRASAYGFDPERVAATGFSAGGHLCADLATRFADPVYAPVDAADRLSARPWAAAPIYPVVSMTAPAAHAGSREHLIGPHATPAIEAAHSPHRNVPDDAPPFFLLHAEDDEVVPVANTLLLREALRGRAIPVDCHLFASGGHGFGLRGTVGKPVAIWPELFDRWIDAR